MLNCEIETVLAVRNKLGEGVIWDPKEQCLWWTDILANKMFRWSFKGDIDEFETPFKLGSFGLTSIKNRFVVAFDFGFAFFEPLTGKVETLCEIESQLKENRMNDGRVDREGRFWAGSMRQSGTGKLGSLYCLKDQQGTAKLDNIEISNGLCWSLDGQRIYHADSPTRQIKVADVNKRSGEITNWRQFTKTAKGAYPDGACIDSENHLWSAQWGSHRVRRYNPMGEEVFEVELPCKQPSCVAFGGPDMQYLFVTSAWEGLYEQPHEASDDGNLFVLKTNVKGIAESICTQT